MDKHRFHSLVNSAEELTALIGTPSELVYKKQLSELDQHMTNFIAESPFLLLGTVGRDGSCDVSPRGDSFGLAQVLDSRTLVIPERRGNRRADSLKNIIETGRVGLLFMIPGTGETLRVNGKACLIRDEAVLTPLAADGKIPLIGIVVEVEECFLRAARSISRSPDVWGRMGPGGFPSLQNWCDLTSSGRVGSIPTRSRHAAAPP